MGMIVLLVCSALAGLLVARNLSAGREAIREEHRQQALGAADVGLAAVQARLALGVTGGFADQGDVGPDHWAATTSAVTSSEYDVRVTGSSAGQSRTISATVRRTGATLEVERWREVPGGP
jgi:hypothetical protein